MCNTDYLTNNLPDYHKWDSIDFINLGWSNDEKYRVTKDKQTYLIRLFPVEELVQKQQEFIFIEKCFNLINCSQPIKCSRVSESSTKGFMLLDYIEGETLESKLSSFSEPEQYMLGLEAGKMLKTIHSLSIESCDRDQILKDLKRKKEKQLDRYIKGGYGLSNETKIINFVQQHLNQILEQSIVYQHGDFHPGNMIIDNQNTLHLIDFNRMDVGDPYEEFLKIELFTVENSKAFSLGQIEGYFNKQIPSDFWEMLKIYSLHSSLFSIVWAESFGEKDVNNMIKRYNRIYSDYNDLENKIPSWTKESET